MRQYTGNHLAAQLVGGVTYIAGELAEVQVALLRVLRAHPIDCGHAIYVAPGDHLDAICAADSAWGDDRHTRETRVQAALEHAQKQCRPRRITRSASSRVTVLSLSAR